MYVLFMKYSCELETNAAYQYLNTPIEAEWRVLR